MTPAQANHQRRIRCILAFRAAAIICLAFAVPSVGTGLTRALTSERARMLMTEESFSWTARVVMLFGAPTLSDLYGWLIRSGRGPALMFIAAYLWLRPPHKLLRVTRKEARL